MITGENREQIVRETVAAHVGRRVSDDQPLISSGIIDSLSIIRLIGALERNLGVKIPTERVQPEDFDSVDLIFETLERVAE